MTQIANYSIISLFYYFFIGVIMTVQLARDYVVNHGGENSLAMCLEHERESLRILTIKTDDLTKIPDAVWKLPNLTVLTIRPFKREAMSLASLPITILSLPLTHLTIGS